MDALVISPATTEAYEEYAVFVPSGANALSAVVCLPTGPVQEVGIVLLSSSAATRVHRNGMWVQVARELAARGFASIRVDYHGTGDSQGVAEFFDLEKPFTEDVMAASTFFASATGITSQILVGTCFGARCAVAAVDAMPDVTGLVLFPTDLQAPGERTKLRLRTRVKLWIRGRTSLARLLRLGPVIRARRRVVARSEATADPIRVSREFEKRIIDFLDRGDVWFIYGDADKRYPQLQRCLEDIEPSLTPERRERLHVEVAPGRWLEKFHSLDDQRYSVDVAVSAVESLASPRSG